MTWSLGDAYPIIFGSSSEKETTKVKIGNDIRLKVQLSLGEEVPNILEAQAFFINTTLAKKLKQEHDRIYKYIGRFPTEPFSKGFQPDPYNINSCGPKVTYHVPVANLYNGFGVYPKWDKMGPWKDMDVTVYRSEVERTQDPKVIIVTFPAEAQKFEGTYELLITAKVYDPGYKNNSRTVTASYDSLFKLVKDQSAADNPVQIEIVNTDDAADMQDVYVVAARYDNDAIHLNRNDMGVIDIDISPITEWYEGD